MLLTVCVCVCSSVNSATVNNTDSNADMKEFVLGLTTYETNNE